MPKFPEGSPERAAANFRIQQTIMRIIKGVGVHTQLPERVCGLIYDEQAEGLFRLDAQLQYLGEGGIFLVTPGTLSEVESEIDVIQFANDFVRDNPNVPLICDNNTAQQVFGNSITWINEGKYRVQGLSNGTIEVYTPYKSRSIDGYLPLGVGGQIFSPDPDSQIFADLFTHNTEELFEHGTKTEETQYTNEVLSETPYVTLEQKTLLEHPVLQFGLNQTYTTYNRKRTFQVVSPGIGRRDDAEGLHIRYWVEFINDRRERIRSRVEVNQQNASVSEIEIRNEDYIFIPKTTAIHMGPCTR